MNLVSIEGYPNLKKDTTNGGVVNVDKRGYQTYQNNRIIALQKVQEQKQAQEEVVGLQNEINTMKGEISEIKNLLLKLLEKGN
jgi:hypothetical protein